MKIITHKKKHEPIVISIGGSLIVPDSIDVSFLQNLKTLIEQKLTEGFSFYIITGGGRTARNYMHAAQAVRGSVSAEDSDWLGIHGTRLNAQLLRTIFKVHARPRVIKNHTRKILRHYPITIGAGWKPGWSTDYCAVLAAKNIGAKKIINLSNIDYVYDSDPKKNPQAKKIEEISWKDFRKLIPEKWDPGLSSPFDPIAAKEAEHLHMQVAIINGGHLDELHRYLHNESFIGTQIS